MLTVFLARPWALISQTPSAESYSGAIREANAAPLPATLERVSAASPPTSS